MSSYNTKVHHDVGGDNLTVEVGGTITFAGGVVLSCDADGNLIFTGLPTSNPGVAGALYADTNVLTISTGP